MDKKGQWQKGMSGNPKGRPSGASKVAAIRAHLAEYMPELVEQLIEKAKGGDMGAARLLLERVLPPVKATEQTVTLDLPAGSMTERANAILQAIADGVIPPTQGSQLIGAVGAVAKVVEVDELAKRIEALENANAHS